MSNIQTQLSYVRKLLLNYGYISRNYCLEERITRLGSRINDLKNEGFEIEGQYVKKNGGKDYQYFLIKAPYKKVQYKVHFPEGDKIITKYEKI